MKLRKIWHSKSRNDGNYVGDINEKKVKVNRQCDRNNFKILIILYPRIPLKLPLLSDLSRFVHHSVEHGKIPHSSTPHE